MRQSEFEGRDFDDKHYLLHITPFSVITDSAASHQLILLFSTSTSHLQLFTLFYPTMNLKLMCLVWPDDNPHDHIFPVKIDDDETIGDLKKLVKNEHAHRLHNVDASDLILWKCSIPADDNLQETLKTVHFDVTQGHFGHKLPPVSKISEHFSTASLLPKTIHILIQAEYHLLSNTSLTKPPAAVEAPDDHRDKRLHLLTEPPHTPPAREKIGTAEMKDSAWYIIQHIDRF